MHFTRRNALGLLGAGSLTGLGSVRFAHAAPTGATAENRLVVVFLRGAMDGLAAVPAYGDPDFERARAGIALKKPGQAGGALDLDGFFGLNPLLPAFHTAWRDREMLVIHALASPYRERSHFDAQNLIENGSEVPYGLSTGWLNRAIGPMPSKSADKGVSITRSVPVIMQGDTKVASWSPSSLPQPSADLIARAGRLYVRDTTLSTAFESARNANAGMAAADGQGFAALMSGAARFLRAPDGPRVAFTESTGWDTHAGQSAEFGPLWQAMTSLNAGLLAFRQEIGDAVWKKTAIVFVTEFGRTVAMNGSNGTDHGTGGAAFVLGGAVAGGRVIADWPGLKPQNLHEGRDLKPTLDLRALFKGVLIEQLGVDQRHIERDVFADSADVRPMTGLVRA